MEVTNLIDIHTREELYAWYLENHDKLAFSGLKEFWDMSFHPTQEEVRND